MNRRGRPAMALATILCAALLCGCDEKPKPPPGYGNNAPKSRESHQPPDPPISQQILSLPRQPQQLGIWPLTIDLPQKLWRIKFPDADSSEIGSSGSSLSIVGPTPSGEAQIQVAGFAGLLRPLSSLDQAADVARKKQEQNPRAVLLVDLRTLGPAKVLEERQIHRLSFPTTQSGDAAAPDNEFVNWTLTVMTPHPNTLGNQKVYDTYVLSVIALSRKQYEQDCPFLEQLLQSIKYHPVDLDSLGP